jgi:hypothetical protein
MKRYVYLLALALTALSVPSFAATQTRTDGICSTAGGPVTIDCGVTIPTTQIGDLQATTASLTVVAGTNIAAVTTPATLNFERVGNDVHVWGEVSLDPTSGSTASTFTVSLPVVRSANFTGTTGANGVSGVTNSIGVCKATNSAKTVTCNYTSGGTAVESVDVNFWYKVTGN